MAMLCCRYSGKVCRNVVGAARHFSLKLGVKLNEATVRTILKAYKAEIRLKQREEEDDHVTKLPLKK